MQGKETAVAMLEGLVVTVQNLLAGETTYPECLLPCNDIQTCLATEHRFSSNLITKVVRCRSNTFTYLFTVLNIQLKSGKDRMLSKPEQETK
jgi:hypothetical protein